MRQLIILLFLAFPFFLSGQAKEEKVYTTKRISTPIKIDGNFNEPVWETANIATGFTQNQPNPGKPSIQKTEVKVLYDNTSIYIAATMYDVSPDSIISTYSNRDEEDNTDIFGIFLDTYNDDRNGYGFVVHPTGVQWDARYSNGGDQDITWDAVWNSATKIEGNNWYAEIQIPYSAIRFSDNEEQVWGVNFFRKIRRVREFSLWNELNPEINGLIHQFGRMEGLKDIESPVRLSAIPYFAAYYENYNDKPNNTINQGYSFNGGMDIKYGINDAFTLDVTLIPDFGQVQSDNQVLNLSPFEVQFQERRPFFTEGTELFNKGGFFYSRRIGDVPSGFYSAQSSLDSGEVLLENPSKVQLINSVKLSGRTRKGLGVGVLNSVTAESEAVIQNIEGETRSLQTEPLSNYSVVVLDQSLKNNSSLSFVNTNVMRNGSAYDANLSAALFTFNNKTNKYRFNGGMALSQQYYNNADSATLGKKVYAEVGKVSGNWQYSIYNNTETDTYNANDLGFLRRNNKMNTGASLNYNIYKPFWKLLNMYNTFSISYNRLYSPNVYSDFEIYTNIVGTFTNWLTCGFWTSTKPIETHDYFEPREAGRKLIIPKLFNVGGFFSSDYRKRFALDGGVNYLKVDQAGRNYFEWNTRPRFRLNDHMLAIYRYEKQNNNNDVGYVNRINGDEIIMGQRNIRTHIHILDLKYIFTNRMGLTFRTRHYWSTATYNKFYLLGNDGSLQPTIYNGSDDSNNPIHDVSFNAFNIDMVYSWVFAPGSQITVTYKNSILSSNQNLTPNYFENADNVLDLPQTNSISFKILYFLDYLYLKKRKG